MGTSTDPSVRGPGQLVRGVFLVALLTILAAVGFAGPAAAHDVLISSDPADGSTLQAAPTSVTLTFDQPVQDFEPVVTVTGPDGQPHQDGSPKVDSTMVTNGVGPLSQAGDYVIAYRVVSADGHPVQGEVKFRLANAAITAATPSGGLPLPEPPVSGGTGASTTASAAEPASASTQSVGGVATSTPVSSATVAATSSSSGLSGWVWAALALSAALIIAAAVVVLRRPRQPG